MNAFTSFKIGKFVFLRFYHLLWDALLNAVFIPKINAWRQKAVQADCNSLFNRELTWFSIKDLNCVWTKSQMHERYKEFANSNMVLLFAVPIKHEKYPLEPAVKPAHLSNHFMWVIRLSVVPNCKLAETRMFPGGNRWLFLQLSAAEFYNLGQFFEASSTLLVLLFRLSRLSHEVFPFLGKNTQSNEFSTKHIASNTNIPPSGSSSFIISIYSAVTQESWEAPKHLLLVST